MELPQEEIDLALQFAREVIISAQLDPVDQKTLVFRLTPEIPTTIKDKEILSTLDICIEYHQRCVFTGEYLEMDENPPVHRTSENPLDDINFYLDHYKLKLVDELQKGLSQDQEMAEFSRESQMTPFAKVMIRHMKKDKSSDH